MLADGPNSGTGSAQYVFGVRFHLDSAVPGVRVDREAFETRLYREAAPPGDERALREEAERALGVTVEGVDFRELRTDEAYLDALKTEIAADLDAFNADSVSEVLSKYLGSSIHVTE